MCFSKDQFEENHRGHIKIAKSCFAAERKKNQRITKQLALTIAGYNLPSQRRQEAVPL